MQEIFGFGWSCTECNCW